MKPIPGVHRVLAMVLLSSALVAACSTSSNHSSVERPQEPKLSALAIEQAWVNYLEPKEEAIHYGPFEVDGRSLILQVRYTTNFEIGPQGHRNKRTIYHGSSMITSEGPYFAILDADTKEAVLPLDYNSVVAVPGSAIYVWTADQLKKKSDVPTYFKLDVHTGTLTPSDVHVASTYQPIQERPTEKGYTNERWIPSDPTVWPAYLGGKWNETENSCQMTIVPPMELGLEPTTLDDVTTRIWYGKFVYLGHLLRIQARQADGSLRTHLFNPDGTLWLQTDRPTQVFTEGTTGSHNVDHPHRVLATRAPGTSPADDLWHLLGENGEFGAPEGAIGLRPLQRMWNVEHGSMGNFTTWLVRRDSERLGGPRWTMVDSQFAPIPGAEYLDLRLSEGPWFNPPENRHAQPDSMDQAIMAVQFTPDQWELYRPAARPSRLSARRDPIVVAPTYGLLLDALQRVVAKREASFRKWEAVRLAAEIERKSEELEQKWARALAAKQWGRAESLAAQRGGFSYYTLVRAVGNPTLAFLERAIAATPEGAQKNELMELLPAVKRRYQDDLARVAREQREEEERRRQFAAGAAAAAASGGSSSSSGSGGGWSVSHEEQRRFRAASSFSQHAVNMGWRRPYDWR